MILDIWAPIHTYIDSSLTFQIHLQLFSTFTRLTYLNKFGLAWTISAYAWRYFIIEPDDVVFKFEHTVKKWASENSEQGGHRVWWNDRKSVWEDHWWLFASSVQMWTSTFKLHKAAMQSIGVCIWFESGLFFTCHSCLSLVWGYFVHHVIWVGGVLTYCCVFICVFF